MRKTWLVPLLSVLAVFVAQAAFAQEHAVERGWGDGLIALAAGLGMAFTFWLGIHSRSIPVVETIAEMTATDEMIQLADAADDLPATVYTPVSGVSAECIDSETASATIVVLEGLAAIPDETDLTRQTAASNSPREIDSTAHADLPTGKEPKP